MMFHGYELISEWKTSTCGKIARGKKDEKLYFIKKYQTPVAPLDNGTLDEKTFKHNKKQFDEFVQLRKKINTEIRTIAGYGGNIIIPCEEFIEGNQYVEVSELIDGAIPEEDIEDVLNSLSTATKKLLMQTAVGALFSVHSKGIIHSDLKIKNVLLMKNRAGNYVAKLIDFDSSYFENIKPEEIIGTIDYYSPELGAYASVEDDDERTELENNITTKSDIFSMGLIFHFYLTGELPKAIDLNERLQKRADKGKVIYCWVALNNGCNIALSERIKEPFYIDIISKMLSLNPKDRPSASEVLMALRVPVDPVIEDAWPDHRIVFDKKEIDNSKIIGIKRIDSKGEKEYELLFRNGKRKTVSKDYLILEKLATISAPLGMPDIWPEHDITFDVDRIRSRGFISGEQTVLAGVKGYMLYRSDSSSVFFNEDKLIAMKCANRKTGRGVITEAESSKADLGSFYMDTPWPEHKINFVEDVIKAKGYNRVEKAELNGIKGYNFYKSSGVQFIRVEMVVIQRMAIKF